MSDVVEAIDEKRRATGRRELAPTTLVKCLMRVAEVHPVSMSNGETISDSDFIIQTFPKQFKLL